MWQSMKNSKNHNKTKKYHDISNESGMASILTVMILFAITSTIVGMMRTQTLRDLNMVRNDELKVDKLIINHSLRFQAACPAAGGFSCTTAGDSASEGLQLNDKDGNTLIRNSNSNVQQTRIGGWNVRIRCDGSQYQVQAARCRRGNGGNGYNCTEFVKNPLTKLEDVWQEIGTLENLCGSTQRLVVYSAPCFGGNVDGLRSAIPSAIQCNYLPLGAIINPDNAIHNGMCFFGSPGHAHGGQTYCPENVVPYPDCPGGFNPTLRGTDRYGWGGLDLTKFTVCERL